MTLKTLPCLFYSLNVSQEKRRKEGKEPPSVAEYVLSATTLLSHSCSLQHSWVFEQDEALSIHLFWSPYVGVSCKYECWRASSASTDTKLHVVSQNHNLPIPADSWDEQKHAGVKLCKLTLLHYSSVAACAGECSVHTSHEGSCGESRWRRGWGSCSPWLQCGKSGRHHGKASGEEQLPHWCSECRGKLTSGVSLLPCSWQTLKDTRSRISGWIGME